MNIVDKAYVFALAAHAAVGQRRKYTNEPYIVHPVEVAGILKKIPHTDDMLAAAYLHDTLEDTGVTYGDLNEVFGTTVADMVLWLTDVSRPEDGNRATRKALDRQHIAAAPGDVQTIKVADLMSNTRSIAAYDVEFARVYLVEKNDLLKVLVRADPILLRQANLQVDEAMMIIMSKTGITASE